MSKDAKFIIILLVLILGLLVFFNTCNRSKPVESPKAQIDLLEQLRASDRQIMELKLAAIQTRLDSVISADAVKVVQYNIYEKRKNEIPVIVRDYSKDELRREFTNF